MKMIRTIANRKPFEVSFIESRTNVLNRDYFNDNEFFKRELYTNSVAKNLDSNKAGSIKDFVQKVKRGFQKTKQFVKEKVEPVVTGVTKKVNQVVKSDVVKSLSKLNPKLETTRQAIEKGTDKYLEYKDILANVIKNKNLNEKDKQTVVNDLTKVIQTVHDKLKKPEDKKELLDNAKTVAENIDKAIEENPQDKEALIKSAGLIALVKTKKLVPKQLKSGRISLNGMIIPQNRWTLLGRTGTKPILPKSAGRIFLGNMKSLPSAGALKSKAQSKIDAFRERNGIKK